MAIKYLLSGPDKDKGFEGELISLLKGDLNGKKKLVAIASTPDDYETNDKYFNVGKVWFENLNTTLDEYFLLDNRINKQQAIKYLNSADIIYLMGGNPFTQFDYLVKNGFDCILRQVDGIILGVSAGSINMAKKAYYSKDEDYPETIIYDGIGLVDITIDPHFDNCCLEQVSEALKSSYIHEIIGLPNASAIRITKEGELNYIGECYRIRDGKNNEVEKQKSK